MHTIKRDESQTEWGGFYYVSDGCGNCINHDGIPAKMYDKLKDIHFRNTKDAQAALDKYNGGSAYRVLINDKVVFESRSLPKYIKVERQVADSIKVVTCFNILEIIK